MKKTKVIIPALGLLVLSTAASVTGTVAWFSMNAKVSVTGMTVSTKVSNNIQIAPVNGEDANNGNNESSYAYSLNQGITAILEPVSSINAVSFWYASTTNVQASGDAKTDSYTAYNHADPSAFNTNYGTTGAEGYADYSFYIKATNSDSAARAIYMSKCNLLYDGAALGAGDRAWRVAVFAQSASKNTAQTTALASTDVKSILTPAGAANFTSNSAVSNATTVAALAYGHVSADNDIATYNPAAVIDASVASGATVYYKITVRLWLEGEDNTCNNDTYAILTSAYSLNLDITIGQNNDSLGDNSVAVTSIGSVAVAELSGTGATRTASLVAANGTASTYAWKNADGTAADGTNNTASYTASAAGTFYCVITNTDGNTFRTPSYTYAGA